MNFDSLINQFLSSQTPASTGKTSTSGSGLSMGSLAAGAALGGLTGYLANSSTGKLVSRKAMRVGRTAAGIGGLALIGGLAYKAYENYKAKEKVSASQQSLEKPQAGFAIDEVDQSSLGMVIVRTMIAAACADGVLDEEEEAKIFGYINKAELSKEEQDFIFAEIQSPLSVGDISALCSNQEMAMQIFSAALMAIQVDTPQERKFIYDLRESLNIDDELASSIADEVASLQQS